VYLDAGLVGMTRPRPALGETFAALRSGDTLVVTALFRLARSSTEAAAVVGRLIDGQVQLVVGDDRYPMDGPALRLLVEGLEVADAVRSARHSQQTKEGLQTARAVGQLRGRPPKMSPSQEQIVVQCYLAGRHGAADLGEMFGRVALHRVPRPAQSRSRRIRTGAIAQQPAPPAACARAGRKPVPQHPPRLENAQVEGLRE